MMAWETRSGGKQYYFRVKRENDRVVKKYIGPASCPVTRLIARLDHLARAQRKAAMQASRRERANYREIEKLLIDALHKGEALIRGKLLTLGYRLGKGRRWNKFNFEEEGKVITISRLFKLPTHDELLILINRAETGNAKSMAQLHSLFDDHPEVWSRVGDLGDYVTGLLLHTISGGDLSVVEAIRDQMASMRRELGGESPSPLEALVVERVIITWLDLQHNQLAASLPRESRNETKFWDQILQRAHERYLQSLDTLARVQSLLGEESDKSVD